jgi:hypothetical protein
MHLDKVELAKLLQNRSDAAERAELARSQGHIRIADGFDRLTVEFDVLLARYGLAAEGRGKEEASQNSCGTTNASS